MDEDSEKSLLQSLIQRDPLIGRMQTMDQQEYIRLYKCFQESEDKNKRNHGMDTFVTHLLKVHKFINQKNGYDIFRGFVCGIEFGKGFIIVNTKRLKRLMCRSKSCVNGCIQKLGFEMVRKQQDVSGFFTSILPGVEPQLCNSRQWCVRRRTKNCPLCFVSFLPSSITDKYGFPPPCDSRIEEETEIVEHKNIIPIWDVKYLLNVHDNGILAK